jgi:uncharacterized protein
VHSAANTERDWPFYGRLLSGAGYLGHPPLQPGVVQVVDADHPATAHLPKRWSWTDEWYDFDPLPDASARVLATADETSYQGGRNSDGAGHPLVWCTQVDAGRSFYTALGHTAEAYQDTDFRDQLRNGLRWAAHLT